MNRKYLLILLFSGLFFTSLKAQISSSSFATKVDFTTGSSSPAPNYFTTGDLNLDGKTDVVIPNSANNTISVFKNTSSGGTISFATKIDSNTLAGGPGSGAIGDLNNDGLPDIILNYGSLAYFSVFKNISTGGNILLAARIDFTASYTTGGVSLADIDGDGKLDVLLTNFSNNSISIYRNTSTVSSISFGTPYTVSSGTGPAVIVTTDFDGDGKVDIAVSNFNSASIYIYKNTSLGTTISLGTPLSLASGSGPNGITLGDVDSDGKTDIATANYSSGSVSVYRNTSSTGSISFATQVTFGTTGTSGPQGITISEIDGDNKPDLCVANRNSANISVFKNQSTIGTITTSSFASRVEFTTGSGPVGLFANDIDNDGRLDLITSNNIGGSFSVLRNQITAGTPTIGGSTINFSGLSNNGMTVSFDKGNGSRRIVLCKASSSISSAPVTGTPYTANSVFGNGSQIGTGNYVVYSDTGTTFTLTGLTNNTTYYFAVFEYNGSGGFANYLTSAFSYITGSQSTLNITYYFSKSTGYLNSLSTWGTNTDGTGTNPTSFSIANSYYFAWNNSSPTINGNFTITGGTTAFILGDGVNTYNLNIPSGYTITTDTLLVKKFSTITVNGTLAGIHNYFEDTTTAQFLGSAVQNIPTASYYNFIVASSVKTMLGNVVVRNSLTLMSSLNINNNILLLGTAANNLGTLNYVTGTIYGGIFYRWFGTTTNSGSSGLFPIGTSTNYLPVQINYTSSPTTAGILGATFVNTIPNNNGLPLYDITMSPIVQVNKVAPNGTWQLTPGTLAGGQYTCTFTATGFWGVSNDTVLRLLRRPNTSSGWGLIGTSLATTGSNSSPVLSRTLMYTFGEFGVGGDSTVNALPVKLIILTVHQENNEAILNWQTASEVNSDHFEIERSLDNSKWKVTGKTAAAGNTTELTDYEYRENIRLLKEQGIATIYYRLKLIDKDGTIENSNVMALNLKTQMNNITLYPLPLNQILKAVVSNGDQIRSITLYDMSGREIITSTCEKLDVTSVSEGIYVAKVSTDKEVYFTKVSK